MNIKQRKPLKKHAAEPALLHMRIALIASRPSIWREIIVPDHYSFFDLHVTVQDAFGWTDSHLHQFFTTSPFQRNSQYRHIAFPMPEMEDVIDERTERLGAWFKKPKDKLWYEYDFGDSWMHEVTLQKILPFYAAFNTPVLLDGARACPPEDCGGIGGFYQLLETLANPKDTGHHDMLEWLGIEKASDFDSETFDKSKVRFQDSKKRLKAYERGFGI